MGAEHRPYPAGLRRALGFGAEPRGADGGGLGFGDDEHGGKVGARGAAGKREVAMDAATVDRQLRVEATETFVRDMLRIMGQPADAENAALVRQIARKIMRAMPVWVHPDSLLRVRS